MQRKQRTSSCRKHWNQVDVERARWWSEHKTPYYGIILRTPSWSQLSWHTWAARAQMDQPTYRIWTVTMRMRLQEVTMQMKPRCQRKVKKALSNIREWTAQKQETITSGITEGDIEICKPCQEQFRSILWVVLPWWEESRCKVPDSPAAWDSSVPGILRETYRPFSSHQFHQINYLAEQKTTTTLGVFPQKCMWSRWAFVTTKPYIKLRRL